MEDQFTRTRLLLGQEAMEKLHRSRIAVFGIGGVGGYVVEALARSGVGALDLIDKDTVSLSNLNRQIIATHSTIGQYKVDVAAARVLDINPDIQVRTSKAFFLPDTADQFDFRQFGRHRHRHRQAGVDCPREGSPCTHHQQHGYRKQAGSYPV